MGFPQQIGRGDQRPFGEALISCLSFHTERASRSQPLARRQRSCAPWHLWVLPGPVLTGQGQQPQPASAVHQRLWPSRMRLRLRRKKRNLGRRQGMPQIFFLGGPGLCVLKSWPGSPGESEPNVRSLTLGGPERPEEGTATEAAGIRPDPSWARVAGLLQIRTQPSLGSHHCWGEPAHPQNLGAYVRGPLTPRGSTADDALVPSVTHFAQGGIFVLLTSRYIILCAQPALTWSTRLRTRQTLLGPRLCWGHGSFPSCFSTPSSPSHTSCV